MVLVVRVMPRARREINALAAWWAQNRLGAPTAVALDLSDAFDLLVEFPGIGTPVENSKSPDTRRWLLKRLSHHIYYRVRGNQLQIVAFWSTDREHGPRV